MAVRICTEDEPFPPNSTTLTVPSGNKSVAVAIDKDGNILEVKDFSVEPPASRIGSGGGGMIQR